MTDSHHLLDEWLIEGAVGDPPRELAVHAAVCESCARRLGAFDSLAIVDVGAAGSPPPLGTPSRVVVGLAWARMGTAILGTMVAAVIIFFSASQLISFVGNLGPGPDGVALTSPTQDGQPPSQGGPQPAVEPSITEPTPTPIPSFIALPSLAPQAAPLDPPNAPSLFNGEVTQTTVSMSWSDPVGGGPVQKWEVWRATGTGSVTWFKIGELLPGYHALIDGGRLPGTTYSYRIRAVNVSWLGAYSNTITATTASPTATPTPPPTPECSDTIDNDLDGWIDFPSDPGCTSLADPSETPADPHACNDTLDNDLDGWTDFPVDPGCSSGFDDSETPVDPHECNDTFDNDLDGLTDFPSDPGCTSAFDDSELPVNNCNDGIDNDGDNLTDWGEDPACVGDPTGNESPPNIYECNDGIDNEVVQDGFIDFGGAGTPDPECASWSDNDEST